METVLLIVQIMLAVALAGLILIQRSDNDGFGMGSGGGGNQLLTSRGTANFLTRATATVATLFMLNSLGLAILVSQDTQTSILDALPAATEEAPVTPTPAAPVEPAVPLAE